MADRICATRAHKNIAQLRRMLPHVFPQPEPEAGYASIAPIEVLARLERATRGTLAGLPASLAGIAPDVQLIRPSTSSIGPLFSGTLWFISLQLTTSTGTLQLAPADLAVAQQFAQLAVRPISRYASQYGPNTAAVGSGVLVHPVSVPNGQYTDQTLQGWVNDLAQRSKLPPTDCLAFLNPPAGKNSDAPVAQGVLGYHGKAQLPYIFVNVLGRGFSVPDPNDQFALALSHEMAEMIVDPRADASNPEVCDPCGPNCQTPFRDYFDSGGSYLGSTTAFPPPYPYGFFLNGIVQPAGASACPAPSAQCAYAPP